MNKKKKLQELVDTIKWPSYVRAESRFDVTGMLEVRLVISRGEREPYYMIVVADGRDDGAILSDLYECEEKAKLLKKYGLPRGKIVQLDRGKKTATVELEGGSENTADVGNWIGEIR